MMRAPIALVGALQQFGAMTATYLIETMPNRVAVVAVEIDSGP